MRTVKKPYKAFERAAQMAGNKGKYVRIPSSNGNFLYTGLLMADGVWVAWPDCLDETEMKLYTDKYGDIPDIFELKNEKADYMRVGHK